MNDLLTSAVDRHSLIIGPFKNPKDGESRRNTAKYGELRIL